MAKAIPLFFEIRAAQQWSLLIVMSRSQDAIA
jgi:hypothetical protein